MKTHSSPVVGPPNQPPSIWNYRLHQPDMPTFFPFSYMWSTVTKFKSLLVTSKTLSEKALRSCAKLWSIERWKATSDGKLTAFRIVVKAVAWSWALQAFKPAEVSKFWDPWSSFLHHWNRNGKMLCICGLPYPMTRVCRRNKGDQSDCEAVMASLVEGWRRSRRSLETMLERTSLLTYRSYVEEELGLEAGCTNKQNQYILHSLC